MKKKILFTKEQIESRTAELGREITEFYRGKDLTVVVLANGGIFFASDLLRQIDLPLYVDTFASSSYVNDASSKGLRIRSSLKLPVENRHVLLVDDVLDTGNSLVQVMEYMKSFHPLSVKSCVCFDKKIRGEKPVRADWTGFPVEDRYLIGYGLDSMELYRNLPYVAALEE